MDKLDNMVETAAIESAAGISNLQQDSLFTNTAINIQNRPETSGLPPLEIGGDNDNSMMACADDGPRTRIDQRLDGARTVHAPAEAGNAHQIIELIQSGQFQNPDGSLTANGTAAIREAIRNCPSSLWNPLQTYEGRTQEVQNYINRTVFPPISLRFDRDAESASHLLGSRPYIEATVGGRTTRIAIDR